MKILHLPVNIASQISTSVRALRSLGQDARGLARNFSPIQHHGGIETLDWFGRPNPAARLWRGLRWRCKLVRALAWADLVHWHWGDTTWKQLDLWLAARLGKPRLVEFWGDDLRDPDLASRDNPYLAQMYRLHPELANQRSVAAQQMFHRHGFACLIPGYELGDYLDPGIFPGFYQTRPRLLLRDYVPAFPEPKRARPLVVHAPSDKARKGTQAVLAAVDELQKTQNFEFQLIHQMPRTQALAVVAGADLFLDQFTVGAEGLAALEAMALGKPVLCFIKESLRARYPDDLPIVTADQESLARSLSDLVADAPRRHELGMQGRRYVETYHDADKLAQELLEIYEDLRVPGGRGVLTNRKSHCRHWRLLAPLSKGAETCVP